MINIVSTGPGYEACMTYEAVEAIKSSDVIVGYQRYVKLIEALIQTQEIYTNGMKGEVERCRVALDYAKRGKTVAIISGGDAGIYGIGGIMQEVILEEGKDMEVRTYPGVTSAHGAAALLGAPIVHDSVYISLSDLLTDLEVIKKRIHSAGLGDFVTCIYNPKSKGRPDYITMARDILLEYKRADTPVGIVRHARRDQQEVFITTLGDMCTLPIDMSTMVIIGNEDTYVKDGKMITPRGYRR